MIDITEREHEPDIYEIGEYIASPLFYALFERMTEEFKALYSIEYSRDTVLLGWNVRFYKAGRTLCRLYPKEGFITVLVVVGRRERERVEALLPDMSPAMRDIYEGTREGMGQRWLLLELHDRDRLYDDLFSIVSIRRTAG